MKKKKTKVQKAQIRGILISIPTALSYLIFVISDNDFFSLLTKIFLIFLFLAITNLYVEKAIYINSCDFKRVEKIQTENGCFKAAKTLDTIKGIVLHSAKGAELKNYVDFNMELGYSPDHWNTKSNTKMPHYFIGYNKNKEIIIINTLSHSHSSFLCGNGIKGSYDLSPNGHLQVIICESEENDEEYFDKAVYTAALQHCTILCKTLHLSPEQIVSDKEAYEKGFAADFSSLDSWLSSNNKTMDDFRIAVKNRLKGK